jgi:hypothetical protein
MLTGTIASDHLLTDSVTNGCCNPLRCQNQCDEQAEIHAPGLPSFGMGTFVGAGKIIAIT